MYQKLFSFSVGLLRFYMKPGRLEEIEGDLVELFDWRTSEYGRKIATFRLAWDVMRFFRWRYIKNLEDVNYLKGLAMYKNYFKISLRNILKHKFFATVNVAGLAIGLTCCFLIVIYVQHEFSYEKFLPDHHRIMRLSLNGFGATPAPFAFTAKEEYPEIEEALRLTRDGDVTFRVDGKVFLQEGGLLADSTFFDFFDWPMLAGNVKSCLTDPSSIVITEPLAKKIFNGEDVMGKLIQVGHETRRVTGIVPVFPSNSHIAFSYVIPLPKEDWVTNGYWTGNNFFTYFKLSKLADRTALEEKFKGFVRKHMAEEILEFSGHDNYDAFLQDENASRYRFFLFPIADLHMHHRWMSLTADGNLQNMYTFSIIALFVLIIASINFMNLATARAGTRSKEVGVRKVLGSLQGQLQKQFLIESLLISGAAVIICLALVLVLIPYFNELSGKQFAIAEVLTPKNLLTLLALGAITGLLSGLYPAFYLSAIQPLIALKGVIKSSKSSFLRKGLVVFQFSVSILLIICTAIVYSQVYFMTHQDLGINTQQTLVVHNTNKLESKLPVFKQEMLRLAEVGHVSTSNSMPATWVANWSYTTNEDRERKVSPDHIFVSPEYQQVLGIKMLAGDFFLGRTTDSTKVIVNESLLKALDWPLEEAIGKVLKRGEDEKFRIAGVMEDFRIGSFRRPMRPLLLRYTDALEKGEAGNVYMMMNLSGNYQKVITKLEENWSKYAGDEILEFSFLDDRFDLLYTAERKFGKIFTTFSILAIFIACMGMFALTAFMIEQRLKEVAVRKVLGAKVLQIIGLFIWSFVKFIIIGAIIAIPVAYYLADEWLSSFVLRIFLNPLLFLMPILGVAALAFITVGLQVLKSGNVNPANLLRNE